MAKSTASHPEKLAVDHKKILIDGDLDFLKEAPFWNQELKNIKFPMDVQKSYEHSKLIPLNPLLSRFKRWQFFVEFDIFS